MKKTYILEGINSTNIQDTTASKVKQIGEIGNVSVEGGTTGDLTLEQARQNGNVLEGDVKLKGEQGGDIVSLIFEDIVQKWLQISNTGSGYENDGGLINLYQGMITGNPNSYLQVNKNGIKYFDANDNEEYNFYFWGDGIASDREFNKQGDRKAFAQLADVYDSNSYSTTETKTGGTWIDGKPIYTITKLTADPIPADIETQFPNIIVGSYTVYKYTKTTD